MILQLQPDPTALPEKSLDLFYDLNKYLKDEDYSILCVRDVETEIMGFQRAAYLQDAVKGSNKHDDVIREINPLKPYLARIGNPEHVSKTEAYLLRDECLNDFKQLSVNKANYILRIIEKHSAERKRKRIRY